MSSIRDHLIGIVGISPEDYAEITNILEESGETVYLAGDYSSHTEAAKARTTFTTLHFNNGHWNRGKREPSISYTEFIHLYSEDDLGFEL